jgi:hypothetical protein
MRVPNQPDFLAYFRAFRLVFMFQSETLKNRELIFVFSNFAGGPNFRLGPVKGFMKGVTMRISLVSLESAAAAVSCLMFCACSHAPTKAVLEVKRAVAPQLKAVSITQPVSLRMHAEAKLVEKVDYLYQSNAKAFDDDQIRHEKEESLEFTSQATTVSSEEPDAKGIAKFTQDLAIAKKDGVADLHDFAMPELGETLRVTMDSLGKVYKSGDYPTNSIFYVPAISLPENPVSVGDTWTMDATWLSLGEMIPYQLAMVSILKGFVECGTDTCADLEVSGDVKFQGPLAKEMSFSSVWSGRIYFAMKAGTVVWSRIDTEERLIAEHARRDVTSCFESLLSEPADYKIPTLTKPTCK